MTVKELIKKLESVEDENAAVIISVEVNKDLLRDKTEEMIKDKRQEAGFCAEVFGDVDDNGDFVLIEGGI
tara:strand:- start:66 stop:275 length:210 start_codon:yes stop_codon:yes gene_type:complete